MGLALGIFFAWELGELPWIPAPPRQPATAAEYGFTALLIALLAFNAGLVAWRRKHGSCPVGTRRASGLAGGLGALALLCPVCLFLPFSLFGLSLSLAFLAPFIPLLRIVVLLILLVNTAVLWPRHG